MTLNSEQKLCVHVHHLASRIDEHPVHNLLRSPKWNAIKIHPLALIPIGAGMSPIGAEMDVTRADWLNLCENALRNPDGGRIEEGGSQANPYKANGICRDLCFFRSGLY